MVAIPTTSGTGSEVTPFAIITDDETHVKYAIADYALTPNMAIIDPNFVDGMPKGLTAASGIDALVHSIEAYVSAMATNFTNSNALEATKLVFRYLERSWKEGANDPIAREKCTMLQQSPVWHLQTLSWDFATQWLTNLVQHLTYLTV